MTPLWYYSNHNQPIGPLTFAELQAALLLMSEPDKALVWRAGLDTWREAQFVRELSTVVSTTLKDTKTETKSTKRSQRTWGGVLTTFVIVGGLAAARHSPPSQPAPNSPISGKTREVFVSEANASCLKKQENDPANKSLSLSHETLSGFCSCYVNALAALITYGDLKKIGDGENLPKDGTMPSDLKSKTDKVSPPCWDDVQKKLMGARQ
jgi:hypothetical protein